MVHLIDTSPKFRLRVVFAPMSTDNVRCCRTATTMLRQVACELLMQASNVHPRLSAGHGVAVHDGFQVSHLSILVVCLAVCSPDTMLYYTMTLSHRARHGRSSVRHHGYNPVCPKAGGEPEASSAHRKVADEIPYKRR